MNLSMTFLPLGMSNHHIPALNSKRDTRDHFHTFSLLLQKSKTTSDKGEYHRRISSNRENQRPKSDWAVKVTIAFVHKFIGKVKGFHGTEVPICILAASWCSVDNTYIFINKSFRGQKTVNLNKLAIIQIGLVGLFIFLPV